MQQHNLDTYLEVRDKMRTGDEITFAGDDLVGRIIRLATKRSHVAKVIRLYDYDVNEKRVYILEAHGIHGISLHLLSERLKEYNGKAWWQPLRPEFEPVRKHIGAWSFMQLGKKYDVIGLFKNALSRVSEGLRALFCSEFCWMATRKGTENAARDGVEGARDLVAWTLKDWAKIGKKAAWPGDFHEFYNTYDAEIRLI